MSIMFRFELFQGFAKFGLHTSSEPVQRNPESTGRPNMQWDHMVELFELQA